VAAGAALADLVRKENIMTTIKAFIKRHSVPIYFVLAFAISWGGMLAVGGLGGISGPTWQSDPRLPFLVVAMLAGPSVASLLLTSLSDGRAGLRELLARLLRWRVGVRWYAVALLTAPLSMTAALLVLSLTSPAFLPGILTTADKAALLQGGITGGLLIGIVEEVGWTGFALPRLRRRYSVLTTALIVGVLWGAWHLLQSVWASGVTTGAISLTIFLSTWPVGVLVGQLTAYRILMGWVYDRTGSLPVAMLMHASLSASTFILAPAVTGVAGLTLGFAYAAATWVVVAAVVVANGGQLSQQGKPPASIGSPQLTPVDRRLGGRRDVRGFSPERRRS
jgi:membrane protease YdiL (CAAX protease family)